MQIAACLVSDLSSCIFFFLVSSSTVSVWVLFFFFVGGWVHFQVSPLSSPHASISQHSPHQYSSLESSFWVVFPLHTSSISGFSPTTPTYLLLIHSRTDTQTKHKSLSNSSIGFLSRFIMVFQFFNLYWNAKIMLI